MQTLIEALSHSFFNHSTSSKSTFKNLLVGGATTVGAKKKTRFEDKYKILELLGMGGFGYIYSAISREGKMVAVKYMRKDRVPSSRWTFDKDALIPMEVSILKSIKHHGVVQFIEMFTTDKYVIVVMELFGYEWHSSDLSEPMQNIPVQVSSRKSMDLFELRERRSLKEEEICHIYRQVVNTLVYLLSIGIVHGDVKDENILVNQDLQVKLIDFGGAYRLDRGTYLKRSMFFGTLEFAAPEVLFS
jgi:serine/threonine protein kinase